MSEHRGLLGRGQGECDSNHHGELHWEGRCAIPDRYSSWVINVLEGVGFAQSRPRKHPHRSTYMSRSIPLRPSVVGAWDILY